MDPFRTLHYEVSPDAAGAEGGTPPEPAASEEEPWTPPTREEWELAQERAARVELYEQGGFQGPQFEEPEDDEPEFELDVLSDDFPARLEAYVDQRIAARDAQAQASQESMERARDVLADVKTRDGDFLNPGVADERTLQLADQMVGEMAARYGWGPRAAEAAIAKAAAQVRAEELAIGKSYHEREMNQNRTLAGASREPAGGGDGLPASPAAHQGGDEHDLVASYFPRGNA